MSRQDSTEEALAGSFGALQDVPEGGWNRPADLGPLSPMRFPRTGPAILDPIIEPLWSGTRVLAHYQSDPAGGTGRLGLFDELDRPVEIEESAVATELRDAIAADEAIVDGILTDQALRGGSGTAPVLETSRRLLWSTGVDAIRRDPYVNPLLAFVGVDLLRLDGQLLVDVPLLERKRLLESVLMAGERVRISAYVRPPIGPWLLSWKAAGFKGVMLKAANSRYLLSGRTHEWRVVTQIGRRH